MELKSLIDMLSGLYSQVTTRLWQTRLEAPPANTNANQGLPIADRMGSHLERIAAEQKPREGDAEDTEALAVHPPLPEKGGLLRFFRGGSRRQGRRRTLDPRMGEQMQARTRDHINKALRRARRGDAVGAQFEARLAETAMSTAGEYLSEEEFDRFKTEVEERLHSLEKPA